MDCVYVQTSIIIRALDRYPNVARALDRDVLFYQMFYIQTKYPIKRATFYLKFIIYIRGACVSSRPSEFFICTFS